MTGNCGARWDGPGPTTRYPGAGQSCSIMSRLATELSPANGRCRTHGEGCRLLFGSLVARTGGAPPPCAKAQYPSAEESQGARLRHLRYREGGEQPVRLTVDPVGDI